MLRRRPRLVGNSGACWLDAAFWLQTLRAATVWAVKGVARCFRPFPVQRICGPLPSCTSRPAGGGELGHPQSRLDGGEQQSVVATTDPAGAVRRGEQSVHLWWLEEGHVVALGAFGRDGEDPSEQLSVFGVLECRVAVHRVDRREAGVAGSGAVAPFDFEVVEERSDHRGVEVVEVEFARRLPAALRGEGEQQPEGVAIGGDGVGAGPLLVDEALGEERPAWWGRWRSSGVPPCLLETLRSEGEQLGDGREIPVRRSDVDMAEIGGEQRHASGDVAAIAIPADQGVDRKAVTEPVDSRLRRPRGLLEAGQTHQLCGRSAAPSRGTAGCPETRRTGSAGRLAGKDGPARRCRPAVPRACSGAPAAHGTSHTSSCAR